MNKGIKSKQQGVYFSGGSVSKVKGRIIESQSSSASEKTGSGPPKNAIFEEILCKKGLVLWCKGQKGVIKLFPAPLGSVGTLLTWEQGRQA
jgi:hypothetical protein